MAERAAVAITAEDAMAKARSELAIAVHEPTALRPDSQWLAQCRSRLDELASLLPGLFLETRSNPGGARRTGVRLEALMDQLDDRNDAALLGRSEPTHV